MIALPHVSEDTPKGVLYNRMMQGKCVICGNYIKNDEEFKVVNHPMINIFAREH